MEMHEVRKATDVRPDMGIKKLYESCYGLFLAALYTNRHMRLADKLRVHRAFEDRFSRLAEVIRQKPIAIGAMEIIDADTGGVRYEYQAQRDARELTLSGV